uniref:Uncharacterized protein n=1 Tax=Fagus sylvatica TaxID=28930 RepID=A0A2N9HTB7_FAGSY
MQRLLNSLVKARGFCTKLDKIVASVLFKRLPVVIPKIDPVVYAFQEFSGSVVAIGRGWGLGFVEKGGFG